MWQRSYYYLMVDTWRFVTDYCNNEVGVTFSDRDKMTAILQITFTKAFLSEGYFVFHIKFPYGLRLLRV